MPVPKPTPMPMPTPTPTPTPTPGTVVFIGFDFFNTGYGVKIPAGTHRDCSTRNDGFVTSVLPLALMTHAIGPPTPPPLPPNPPPPPPLTVGGFSFVGCFLDDIARDFAITIGRSHTHATCHAACLAKGTMYFALQDGDWCACDDTYSTPSDRYPRIPDDRCHKAGYPRYGGGAYANAVFQVIQTPPLPPLPPSPPSPPPTLEKKVYVYNQPGLLGGGLGQSHTQCTDPSAFSAQCTAQSTALCVPQVWETAQTRARTCRALCRT